MDLDDAWLGIFLLNRDGRFAIAVAALLYRGIDFFDFTREQLSKCSNVTCVRGNIDRVEDGPDRATVIFGRSGPSAVA